jgi:hypothetical protein
VRDNTHDDMRKHIDVFSERLAVVLNDMDVTEATEGKFDCPVCEATVRVKLIHNGDAYAYCETEECFQTGLIHRHKQVGRKVSNLRLGRDGEYF